MNNTTITSDFDVNASPKESAKKDIPNFDLILNEGWKFEGHVGTPNESSRMYRFQKNGKCRFVLVTKTSGVSDYIV